MQINGPFEVRVDADQVPPDLRAFFKGQARTHADLVARYGFTHTGSIPNGVQWGLRYPEPMLYVHFPRADTPNEFLPCPREAWVQFTEHAPPWPWLPDGSGLDYAATHDA